MGRKKKEELDQLSKDVIACEAAGYGVHYGHWKAAQNPVKIEKKIPPGFKACAHCGKLFKGFRNQKYCDVNCQRAVAIKRYNEKKARLAQEELEA